MPRLRPTAPPLAALAALALAALAVWFGPWAAGEGGGATPTRAEAGFRSVGAELRVAVRLPAAGPWRAFALAPPPRLVIALPEGPMPAAPPPPPPGSLLSGARAGAGPEGRPRLVLDLARPARLMRAELTRHDQGAGLRFALAPGRPSAADWPEGARPKGRAEAGPAPADPRPLVMIDPGHGGIDPGAHRGDAVEKALVLDFALDLAAAIDASGRWRAALTRDDDRYLGLTDRVGLAESAGASALLSIHANTVSRGAATGATVFTLSDGASDAEAEALAALENRAEAVGGVGLTVDGDDVARALIDLSRRRALARGRALGEALAASLGAETPMLRDREHAQAGFRVLTSAEVPSALIELGFLTDAEDLARMRDPAWRRRAASAILNGLDRWRRPEDGPRPATPLGLAALPPARPGD
ncbi:MAG: N-acetylmuramoyl-L-alanine amidase [Paracoccaceae bacterium]